MSKSTLLGINLKEAFLQEVAAQLGCEIGVGPIKYLRMLLGGNPRHKEFWEPVVSKVQKDWMGWKRGYLSRVSRLTLITSVLSSILMYYLSVFRAPKCYGNIGETYVPLLLGRFW